MSWICCFWDEKRLHSLSQGILSRPRVGYLSIQSPDIQINPISVCKLRQTIGSWTLRNISWHTPWTVFASLFLNQIPKSHSRQLCVSYYKLNCDSSSCFQMKMHTALSRNDSFVKCWAHLRELCVNRITGAPVFMVSLQDLQVSTHFYSNRGVQNYACSLSYNMSQNKCKQKSQFKCFPSCWLSLLTCEFASYGLVS